jgi:hypothetical protein
LPAADQRRETVSDSGNTPQPGRRFADLPNLPAFPGHQKGEKNGGLHDKK